jgi:hypothetical protein
MWAIGHRVRYARDISETGKVLHSDHLGSTGAFQSQSEPIRRCYQAIGSAQCRTFERPTCGPGPDCPEFPSSASQIFREVLVYVVHENYALQASNKQRRGQQLRVMRMNHVRFVT